MKQHVFALFPSYDAADTALAYVVNELEVDTADISYIYKNEQGTVTETTEGEGVAEGAAEGAGVGAILGAAVGLAAAAGIAGPLGPVLVSGPLATALGLGGAVGATATGAVAGAATGGLVGALVGLGVSESKATQYETQVASGNVLVGIYTADAQRTADILSEHGGKDVEIVTVV